MTNTRHGYRYSWEQDRTICYTEEEESEVIIWKILLACGTI